MVYGDSFIKAEFSQLDKTFAKRLEAKLGAIIQIPAEAINAGIVGYGPDQILLKMEEELPRLKPDLTIEAVFADNDFGDLLWHKLFKLGDDDRAIPSGVGRRLTNRSRWKP
jgi:hypothetical protein